jgi:hypothetical protein
LDVPQPLDNGFLVQRHGARLRRLTTHDEVSLWLEASFVQLALRWTADKAHSGFGQMQGLQ